MMRQLGLVSAFVTAVASCGVSGLARAASVNVIPKPRTVRPAEGTFTLGSRTAIYVLRGPAGLKAVGDYLAELLRPPTGFGFPVRARSPRRGERCIRLVVDAGRKDLGEEGYLLECAPNGVTITGAAPAGVFYGIQTLRQLLPTEIENRERVAGVEWRVSCVTIEDQPRFGWRGMMLDVCRHFQPKDFVKKYIDILALHKLNRLHIHLTEDQGWRIEIRRYPELSRISAWRGKNREGGIYSRDDIREIVAYAASRHVMVIPEIEMPGHSQAALAAFPDISCTGGPFEVSTRWGVRRDVYCAGNEKTFEFLENVLAEVVELFPGPYVHIGGDECPKDRWKKCAKCQARIKAEGLKNEHELQSWFIRRMERYLNSKGKRIIGWDEILEGGLAPGATVQSWRGTRGGIAAARADHDVIMSPNTHCYFDYYQGPRAFEPKAIGGYIPLEKIYSYEPVPGALNADQAKRILGLQGNVWSEYIATGDHVEYMSFPRGSALAEVGWTPAGMKDLDDFRARLRAFLPRLDIMGVNYRRPVDVKKIGRWRPSEMSATWKLMKWDVTEHLTGAGNLGVTFDYTKGAHRLDIRWAALLEDGKEVARDAHPGTTGSSDKKNTYRLDLPKLRPGARYFVHASVRSDGGTDSSGDIWLRTLPPGRSR